MALGPGKYDDLASHCRGVAEADGVLILVINGTRGSGFSAQLSLELTLALPTILRDAGGGRRAVAARGNDRRPVARRRA